MLPGGGKVKARRAARPRAQLNVLLSSYEWIDWVSAAVVELGPTFGRKIEKRDIVVKALEHYKTTLKREQRQAIDARALLEARRRGKG